MVVGLALTASEYVDCKDLCPDEFLDLAMEPSSPILPVFASSLNTHFYLLLPLKIFDFPQTSLFTAILRC